MKKKDKIFRRIKGIDKIRKDTFKEVIVAMTISEDSSKNHVVQYKVQCALVNKYI